MTDFTQALETRLQWLKWSKKDAYQTYLHSSERKALPLYQYALETGETFVMNKHFGEVVNQARLSFPDELMFDPKWLVSKYGWMWLEEPIDVPTLDEEYTSTLTEAAQKVKPKISAVAWYTLPSDDNISIGTIEVLFFLDFKQISKSNGFGMWSYFTIQPNAKVLPTIKKFESLQVDGIYKQNKETELLHEMRWFYTAMHIMSQKLATTVEHRAERGTRRRFEREESPIAPFLRIVTLRRLEEARQKDPKGYQVDWQWKWHVVGHWRNQYFPSEQTNKIIWVEEYIKGPPEKPLKPFSHTIFKVQR